MSPSKCSTLVAELALVLVQRQSIRSKTPRNLPRNNCEVKVKNFVGTKAKTSAELIEKLFATYSIQEMTGPFLVFYIDVADHELIVASVLEYPGIVVLNQAWVDEGKKPCLMLMTCFDGIIAANTVIKDEHLGIDLSPETGERKIIYHYFGKRPKFHLTPEQQIDVLIGYVTGDK